MLCIAKAEFRLSTQSDYYVNDKKVTPPPQKTKPGSYFFLYVQIKPINQRYKCFTKGTANILVEGCELSTIFYWECVLNRNRGYSQQRKNRWTE